MRTANPIQPQPGPVNEINDLITRGDVHLRADGSGWTAPRYQDDQGSLGYIAEIWTEAMTELRGVPDCSYMARTYLCRKCGQDVSAVPGAVNAMHGYRLDCADCGSFVAWSGYLATVKDKHLKLWEKNTMENLPATNQPQANTPAIPGSVPALALQGDPEQALACGQKAAKALMDFAQRAGAIMDIRGQRYLKSEGWLFLAKAFGVTVRITAVDQISDRPLTFRASAEVLDHTGQVVGQGFGFCSASEKTWGNRPAFALASMSQTRATVRALRPALGWIPVLGGFEPTPSDEMPSDVVDAQWTTAPVPPAQPATEQPQPQSQGMQPDMISEPQRKKIFAMGRELGMDKDAILARCNAWLKKTNRPEVASLADLDKWAASGLIEAMGKAKPTVDPVPA